MIRSFVAVLLLSAAAAPAAAANMTPVAPTEGYCARTDVGGICQEWKLTAHPDIRFIAQGFEDGIDYGFYARRRDGRYVHRLSVYPFLRDDSRGDALFWGYPQDIRDIVVATGSHHLVLQATFDHGVVDDSNIAPPAWQKRLPGVLLVGRTTQPQMTVAPQRFVPLTLDALRKRARQP